MARGPHNSRGRAIDRRETPFSNSEGPPLSPRKDQSARTRPMRISALSTTVLVLAALGAGGTARATDYYVSPTGSDSAAGTMAAPWATLQKGASTAVAGDTVWIRGGTYAITTPATSGAGINFTKSGTSSANINYFAYQGEHPKFDFTNLVISTTGYTMGFTVSGSYLHFKGLEILLRADEHVLQQRHLGDRQRRLRHLRAARHARQQRQRDLHRQQERRRPPGAQLRRARQLRRHLEPGPGAERRRLRRPLPDERAPRPSSAAAAPGGTPTTATTSSTRRSRSPSRTPGR